MIELKSQQAKQDQLRDRQRDRQSLESAKLSDIKQFRKCCKTCKDQNNQSHSHSHSNSFSSNNVTDENSRE